MKLLKKIFSPTILTISILLLFYTFYISEIYHHGNFSGYYLPYYIISVLLLFFSFITFFIDQKIKEYLIIIFITLVTTLYLFELYLTLKNTISAEQISKKNLYEKKTGKKWDNRTGYEFYKDLKKKHNKIVLYIPPVIHIDKDQSIFPLSGISNSKTIHCNENGYFSIYQSDRYGFNNPDTEWDKKEIEYLLIGDSFVHGACVNRPNDISSVLRRLSNKTVLNLGYAGNGPLIQYATLREYINKKVKKVLWVYYEGNDLNDLSYELKKNFLMIYLNDLEYSQNLKLKQNIIDNLSLNIISEMESFNFKLFKFIKISKTRSHIKKDHELRAEKIPFKEFRKLLKSANTLVSKNNSKLYFIYLPEFDRYKKDYDTSEYNLINNIVSELNIPFIDIHKKVFENKHNPLNLFPFNQFGHYTVDGYREVAEAIYRLSKD